MTSKPDFSSVYKGLKDFQKESVDYIFHRLYMDPDRVNRFLIADEVGLGKTLVAKGIIAKSLDYLWDKIERLDIIYICSNEDIARQNINRLNLASNGFSLATRITMLPDRLKELNANKLNFVSFTPGTSFNLRSSTGIMRERALIYSVLREAWEFENDPGPINLMQCSAYRKNWREYLTWYLRDRAPQLDTELKQGYVMALQSKPEIKKEFLELSERSRSDKEEDIPWRERNRLIGELRFILATSCIHAMKPDIIILDEFQRFKHLLDDQDPMSKLAQHLFNYNDSTKPVETKVLLLSATPYKMYTMYHENEEDDHHTDLLRTLRFLYDSEEKSEELKRLFQNYRRHLYSPDLQRSPEFDRVKQEIETKLRKVMVRTERLALSDNRNGMIKEHYHKCDITAEDLLGFSKLDSLCKILGVGDHLEFWKSSPFLINLMDDYALKKRLKTQLENPDHYGQLSHLLSGSNGLLRWSRVRRYKEIEAENPRLRKIIELNVDKGWRLLWVPPSLPYYQLAGEFASKKVEGFTKMLVFSSWKVVPKTIAALCSYEVERRAVSAFEKDITYSNTVKKISPLLQFSYSDGRYTGMPALALLYPCLTLAIEIDPFKIAMAIGGQPTKEQMEEAVKKRVEELFDKIVDREKYPATGAFDEKWYWAALALLDRGHFKDIISEWLKSSDETSFSKMIEGREDGEGRYSEHVNEFANFFEFPEGLGRIPDDINEVLAKFALASPAVTALRSLRRKVQNLKKKECLAAAAKIAVGFRSTFNQPVAISILRQENIKTPYWRRVLDYSVDGNLQAVLDEYIHVLYESLGLMEKKDDEITDSICKAMYSALSLRTTRAEFDDLTLNSKKRAVVRKTRSLRCRYALRMQESRSEDGEVTREEQVRTAFNSPFWPFILSTTSIGQEGLDFHQYCHAICHWNLPSNPVDLEQREGRIHRYKGHVIRKNLAAHYGLARVDGNQLDPWDSLFASAVQDRRPTDNDIVPFWLFEKGSSKIERHIPLMPLSREVDQIEALTRGLVLYRMVFGQPRQEDLINFLEETMSDREIAEIPTYRIDLEPKKVRSDL